MNLQKYVYLFLFISFFSCGENIISKPERLLSKQEMENLMYDLAIIDALRDVDYRLIDTLAPNLQEIIYKKHNVDCTLVVNNMIYYSSLPKEYDKIIKNVENRLKKERESLSEETKKEESNKENATLPIDSLENLEPLID